MAKALHRDIARSKPLWPAPANAAMLLPAPAAGALPNYHPTANASPRDGSRSPWPRRGEHPSPERGSLSRLTAAVRMFVTHKRWCARLAAGRSGRLCLKPLRLVAPRTAPLWRGGIRLVQLPWPRLASRGVQMQGRTGSHPPSSW